MTVTHLHAVDNPLLLKHARSQPVELELLLRIPRPHADVKRALQQPRYLQQVKYYGFRVVKLASSSRGTSFT